MARDGKSQKEGIGATLRVAWAVLGKDILPHRKTLAGAFALRLATNVNLLGPLFLGLIIDRALPGKDLNALWVATVLLVSSYGLSYAFWAVQARLSNAAVEGIFLHLRLRLLGTVLNKHRGFFLRFTPGDLFTRIVHDVDFASAFFYHNLLRSVSYLIYVGATAAFMLAWNWRLGLFSLLMLAPCYVFADRMNRPLTRRSETAKNRLSEQNEVLLDILGGHGEVRFFQQQRSALRRFERTSAPLAEANVQANVFGEWMWGGLDVLSQLLVLAPFIAGCFLYCAGGTDVTVGMLAGFYAYLAQLAGRIQFLFGGLGGFGQAVPSLRRIGEVLDFPEESAPERVNPDETPEDTGIEFRGVSFQFPEGPKILDGFDLRVPPGDKVAIMGASGAGKSTLMGLLLRFYEQDRGEIRFGGKPVGSYDPAFFYSFFGYVSQRTNLFDLTLRENVALGWHAVPEDRVWAVLDVVRLKEVVEALPRGLDTPLGPRGVTLSGGQAQRLALARALVREPAVLILDEFTSGLDRTTEEAILDDLFVLFRDQTVLCVTHSPPVASRFPRVIHLPQ
ncbi:MAG: ABC transporter ATP-binding protein [Acidobacteria bacterium]|nr:ABC transporter ATP-binding protein [Acidobacteriota bacterium]